MSIIKYLSFLFLAFVFTFVITFFIYFSDIKGDAVQRYHKQNYNISLYLKELLQNTTIDNDFAKIDSSIKTFLSIDVFKDIELNYQRFLFSKKAILLNSNKINNVTYKLSDVTTDYRYGAINKLSEDIYEFIPNILFDTKNPVAIKFQAYDDGDVYNSTAILNFYKLVENSSLDTTQTSLSWLDDLIQFEEIQTEKNFFIQYENNPFVEVKYTLNKSQLIEQTKIFIKKIFIYSFSLFVITSLILYIFYRQVVKKDIEKPIKKIEQYLNEILNNRYVRLETLDTKLLHIDKIFTKIQLLSKKVASLTNESNINKELLARKDFVDEITALPNKKVFEKDMKTMFVTNKNGYVVLGKINNLGEFSDKNGSNDANHLIKDFGHSMVAYLKKFPKINSTVYRFYGAEFAMIIEVNELENLKKIIQYVAESLQNSIKSKYLIEGDIAYFGATPFDNYGTIDTMLHGAYEAYLDCVTQKTLYSVSDNAELLEKTKKHEIAVRDIIQREDFTVRFIYDTYEMDDEQTLVMQDASPIILDSDTFEKFPIGIFISVAEKLQLSSTFDKILIEKVLSYLEYEKMTHKIVINLSINSLVDKKFLSWLEGILLYNEIAKKNFIFSVTSYNAKENLEKFKNLIEVIHKFDSKILLKRFSLDDFSLEELNDLDIDYIRLNKDYCIDINNDRARKHAVKNIILYGEMNDIYILGDLIQSDEDYKTMSRLGLYATSR